jgi:integrase
MSYLRLTPDQYDKLLEQDPKITQMNICDYISYLRKQKIAAHKSVGVYVAAIRKFYSMNDVQMNWDKIHSFEGYDEQQWEDRPYTHSEISTLIQHSSPRNRSIILLMCSSGLRVGAIPLLRIRDLEPVDKYHIYKVNVYARSRKSRYFSWCTPEARKEIDSYLDHRKRWDERLKDDSPLFRIEYNPETDHELQNIRPIQTSTVRHVLYRLLQNTGLRAHEPLENGKRPKRGIVMMSHGFRKFFETNAYKAGMDHMYLRRLMGQKSGLEDSYLKLSEEELLEGDSRHVGYIGILDSLTIDESQKLKREVQTLKQEVTRFDKMQKQIEELNRRMGLA